jgi:VWFA-related protein
MASKCQDSAAPRCLMIRLTCFSLLALAGGGNLLLAAEGDPEVVFRSDVSLVRVDAQVVDRANRTITGLGAEDFVLREEGRAQPIRNFSSESMPVEVVLLLDVSRSMRTHIERIASAAHQALRVLGAEDRVAIMVFNRAPRLRLSFRSSRDDMEREFEALLRQETFLGGTDITGALLDAADYAGREARSDARRAIVIVTDDQTERDRDVAAVSHALAKANAVLCALIAPDAMRRGPGVGRGPGVDGPWPGGAAGGPLGGIILGRRGPNGRRGPGSRPVPAGPRTQSAGTAEIARSSGGDSVPVDDASALKTTLARIRQRYALHFYVPEGVKPGQERRIEVELADAARGRYPGAEVRYRKVYISPNAAAIPPGSAVASRSRADTGGASAQPAGGAPGRVTKRRPAVNEPAGPRGAGGL